MKDNYQHNYQKSRPLSIPVQFNIGLAIQYVSGQTSSSHAAPV